MKLLGIELKFACFQGQQFTVELSPQPGVFFLSGVLLVYLPSLSEVSLGLALMLSHARVPALLGVPQYFNQDL